MENDQKPKRSLDVSVDSFVNLQIPDDLDLDDETAVDNYVRENAPALFTERLRTNELEFQWEIYDDE